MADDREDADLERAEADGESADVARVESLNAASVWQNWLARMRLFTRTFRFRLTAFYTGVVALMVLGTLVVAYLGMQQILLLEMDERLREDVAEAARAISHFHPDWRAIEDSVGRQVLTHQHERLFVQVFDAEGELLWSSRMPTDGQEFGPPQPGDPELLTVDEYRVAQRRIERLGLIVRAGDSRESVEEGVARRTVALALAGLMVLVFAPLGSYWMAGRATRSMGRLIRTAARLRPGRLEERLPVRKVGDEIDLLSITVNRFLDEIAAYLAKNREFVANAAHELRSPLAAIQSAVEVTLQAPRGNDDYRQLLEDIVAQCSDLGRLVNQLLLLAESDASQMPAQSECVRLDRLVESALDMFQGVAEERETELVCRLSDCGTVLGNPSRIRQVVQNLLDNAIKFTPRGGRIEVELAYDAPRKQQVLTVSDNGPGIAPDDLPRVFDRFFRADKARRRESDCPGAGLGLSICQAIVATHGGTIEAESTLGAGATFRVRLPAVVEPTGDTPRHESAARHSVS